MWIDLTWSIHPHLATWPGDPSPEMKPLAQIDQGDSCNITWLQLSSHTGTHLDAPFHFEPGGKRLHQLDLEALIGPARIYDFSDKSGPISREDLEGLDFGSTERVLFKTRSGGWLADSEFRSDFVGVSAEAAELLVDRGIRLVGIDYLSIEPFGSKSHPVHHTLLGNEVVVVEGLDLRSVQPGDYELICLPLKILDGDGCPCRAVAKPICDDGSVA